MKDLTIIIPVHTYTDEIKPLLKKAIDSCKNADKKHESPILIVGPNSVLSEVRNDIKEVKWISYLENEVSDFSTQINKAVDFISTTFFSILEFDDTYTPNWFSNAEDYIKFKSDVSVYLPLTEIVDLKHLEEGPIGYVNEVVWASSFSEEIGYLDMDSLQSYMNFNTTGAIFRRDDFIAVGSLKPSFKLSFWYEFLLRLIHKGKKVYTIPKVGYEHYINREGSLTDTYNKTMSSDEADWWIETAKKQFYFTKDKGEKYEE